PTGPARSADGLVVDQRAVADGQRNGHDLAGGGVVEGAPLAVAACGARPPSAAPGLVFHEVAVAHGGRGVEVGPGAALARAARAPRAPAVAGAARPAPREVVDEARRGDGRGRSKVERQPAAPTGAANAATPAAGPRAPRAADGLVPGQRAVGQLEG